MRLHLWKGGRAWCGVVLHGKAIPATTKRAETDCERCQQAYDRHNPTPKEVKQDDEHTEE